eukprot:202669_1
MSLKDLQSTSFGLIFSAIIVSIGFVHALSILVYHILRICAQLLPNTKPPKLQYLSIVVLSTAFITTLMQMVNVTGLSMKFNPSCMLKSKITLMLLESSKFSMYFLFMERQWAIFSNAADFQFKTKTITISRIAMALYYFMLLTFTVMAGKAYPVQNEIIHKCIQQHPIWLLALFQLGEIIFFIAISISYSRRLLQFNRALCNSKQSAADVMYNFDHTNSTFLVARKSTLLTLLAGITTLLALIMTLLFGFAGPWMALDFAVNAWCIILMFRHHQNIYKKCCGSIENILSPKFLTYYSCSCCETELHSTSIKTATSTSSRIDSQSGTSANSETETQDAPDIQ